MVSDGKASDGAAEYGSPRSAPDPEEPASADVAQYLSEAHEQAMRYLSAQAGRFRALAFSAALFGLLGIAGAFVGLTIVIVACVLFCEGIAEGIAQLLGGRQWAGDLITGGMILGGLGAGGYIAINQFLKASRKRTVASWAERRSQGSARGTSTK